MNTIPQYCQKCREKNDLGEPTCRKCGTRLMLVVFPHSLKYDTNHVPSYYEDHLLERVTTLELRLSQITERLAATLDLMLRQTKTAHSDHLLLETLIESLNSLGAIEKNNLTKIWQKRVLEESINDNSGQNREKQIGKILKAHTNGENTDLFEHLVREGVKLFDENQEKQAFLTLERALLISPDNSPLLFLLGLKSFRSDKYTIARNYLENGLKAAPQNLKIKILLAVIYADQLGEVERASEILASLPDKKSKLFCVSFMRAMIAAAEGKWNETLAAFKETLTLQDQPEIRYLTACAYFQLGKNKTAARHLQKAVETDENFADAWFMLSVIYSAENNPDKALQSIETAKLAREAGAQCVEFLKSKSPEPLETALPFLRLKKTKNRLLSGNSSRLNKIFKGEFDKIFG